MYLPSRDRAIVELAKPQEYCLNPEHPRGKHKARVFASALGVTAADSTRLQQLLRDAALTDQAEAGERDEFGQRYTLDSTVVGVNGLVTVRSIWMVKAREEVPRLVTCYVL